MILDKFRPSGKSVSMANPANLEKIALLKASHFEKRRQEKLEAVLHEVKLLLENPNRRPHKHLAAADSHKIINSINISNSTGTAGIADDGERSFKRLGSCSYLSAGYSSANFFKSTLFDIDGEGVEEFVLPDFPRARHCTGGI